MRSGDGRTVVYNAENKPKAITKSSASIGFIYGADGARVEQTTLTSNIFYVDKAYEWDSDGAWRAYLSDVAVVGSSSAEGSYIRFLLKDALGSTVTTLDHNGSVASRRYFDPFGKAGDDQGSESTITSLDGGRLINRGFTDHEHLDSVALIHMNGRAYDYNLGRFLSVDPFIQSPDNSQSFNPYSYIMNNPLAGVDPTGYHPQRNMCDLPLPSGMCSKGLPISGAGGNDVQVVDQRGSNGNQGSSDGNTPQQTETEDNGSKNDNGGLTNSAGFHYVGGKGAGGANDQGEYSKTYSAPSIHYASGLSTFDKVQTFFDGLGMTDIPFLSQGADIVSGGMSVITGDWKGAMLSGIGMIPLFGEEALAAKIGSRLERASKEADKVEDIAEGVTKRGPLPNGGNAKPHGNANHNSAIDNRVGELKQDSSVSNIRKNQQQVDVNGNKVGTNRPDIQYDQGGCHYCVEYDHVPRNSTRHGDKISANDPNVKVELNLL
ncbi:RHS repeat-associated core domain-containing protein [Gallaecimonas mangrovi]|uniref:RHS repeat-associated core domain-containing protein n=1 Tax=Gallaecimonas mangrovi TaxID=2291597 RepID=UPI000E2081E5|nr:RHS repeat-associated core domain-containing protein [Gallaecimonas mangrovi]